MIRSPSGADIDGLYRYRLWREWDAARPSCLFVMLNPSTADASKDDPTIRRCLGFARSWGFGRLDVVNLYAYRATEPDELWNAADPIGPRNDVEIGAAMLEAHLIVAAWGANTGPTTGRDEVVLRHAPRFRAIHHLGLTRGGFPRHPLYVPAATTALVFRECEARTVPGEARGEGKARQAPGAGGGSSSGR